MKTTLITLILINLLSCKANFASMPGYSFQLFRNTEVELLALAVENEDIDQIEKLININNNINYQEPIFGQTLLTCCIVNQKLRSFKKLLELGANTNIPSFTYNRTALIVAVENAHLMNCETTYVEEILNYGGDPNSIWKYEHQSDNGAISSEHSSLLMIATKYGCINIIRLLVERGAEFQNRIGEQSCTALGEAIKHDNIDAIYYFINDLNTPIPDTCYFVIGESGKLQPISCIEGLDRINCKKIPNGCDRIEEIKRIIINTHRTSK